MSYADLVVLSGDASATAASGVLTITNNAISASDVCLASFATAVGTASAAIQLRCITTAGVCTITAVDNAGAAVAVQVLVNFIILRPSAANIGNGF
jgi:hypothetical protein